MTIRINPNAIDYAETSRQRNIKASDRLLALLQEHHGKKPPTKVYLPAIIYPDPILLGCERAATRADALKAMAAGRKEPWFKVIQEVAVGDVTLRDIERACCKHFNIRPIELHRRNRSKEIVRRRSIAIYLARDLTAKSWPQIGRMFGDLDHTSAIAAERRIAKEIKDNTTTCADVAVIAAMLGRPA